MEVIGISNTSERCSAEGRITVLVRDSTGKLLNLDLGIGYSSRLVPKSIISVAQLMTKGSIFHFERGNCYLRTPTNQRISITERNGHTARGYHQYLGPTPPLMHVIYITESLV